MKGFSHSLKIIMLAKNGKHLIKSVVIPPKYIDKANDSFITKWNLFLFYTAIHPVPPDYFTFEAFDRFQITEELEFDYSRKYWQYDYEEEFGKGLTVRQVFQKMADLEDQHKVRFNEWKKKYVTETFRQIFPIPDFKKLFEQEHCYYCGITKAQIEALADKHQLRKKKDRGWNLEVDRLNSNYEYTPENTVLCCYWCNNAKTDEFTPKEFKVIGQAIREVWQKRLAEDDIY